MDIQISTRNQLDPATRDYYILRFGFEFEQGGFFLDDFGYGVNKA
jgi:hypothetical protein